MTWFVSSLVFVVSGILFVTNSPTQHIIDYTQCDSNGNTTRPEYIQNTDTKYTQCDLTFTIEKDLQDVLIYYQLNNFYQNHRKYVKSKSDDQILGTAISGDAAEASCTPLGKNKEGKIYYPCGLIANSQFDDIIVSLVDDKNNTQSLIDTGLSWSSDKDRYKKTKHSPEDIVPPPRWQYKYKDGKYSADTLFDIEKNEDLQVWMRVAPFSSFNKLWRRVDKLSAGKYTLKVNNHFDILQYGGQKKVVITNASVLGDSTYLGYMYVGTGVVCMILGLSFLIKHQMNPRYIVF